MKITVFVGTSVDGFIARPDGSFDFLPVDGGGDNGYKEFVATVDAIVIGRKTYETVLAMGGWFYGRKRVVVLSTRQLNFSGVDGVLEQMSGSPEEVVARLEASGAKHLYVDGGETIQRFLRAGLVTRMVITRVPVLIGEGISLFGKIPRDIKLRHVGTKTLGGAMVQSEYEVE